MGRISFQGHTRAKLLKNIYRNKRKYPAPSKVQLIISGTQSKITRHAEKIQENTTHDEEKKTPAKQN